MKPGARHAPAGAIGEAEVPLDVRALYLKDLSFFGCTVLDDGVFARLIGHIESGRIKPLVAETHQLSEIAAAQENSQRKGHIGQIVLTVG